MLCSEDGEVISKLTSTIERLAEATTKVAIEGKRVLLDDVLSRTEIKRSLLSVSFANIEDCGFGCLTVAVEENEKMKKVADGMAELAKQREELDKMKADLEEREKLLKDTRKRDDDDEVVEPPHVPRRQRRRNNVLVLDDSDSDEDSDHPLVFAPVRSRRRVITPRTPSPPPRMSLDLIVKLFVTLSISGSGNTQMIHYDYFVNGNRFWVLSGFHRQQGVGGKFSVYETEEGAVIAKGMAGCHTLTLPHRVFVAAEEGATSVDLCPGERYFDAEPSSTVEDTPHSVKSLLTSISVSCRTYTCVRMNTMVLAYVGMYDREKAASRKGGRHLVIGYVWFSLRAVDYEFLFSVGIQNM